MSDSKDNRTRLVDYASCVRQQAADVDLAGGKYNRTPLTVAKTSDLHIGPGGSIPKTQDSGQDFGAL
ncbi:MAG TPA: hypothetical protein VLG74_13615 [Blastocatellia bacterium]|nr:hypothetical protein [Blastocatellia bacterium]